MTIERGLRLLCGGGLLLALVGAVGCDPEPPPSVDTGARAVAEQYATAVLKQNWSEAYGLLHPDSRARYRPEEFARQAGRFRHGLGVEPQAVQVRFCQEMGPKAVAHLVWNGAKGSRRRFVKDTVILRPTAGGWGVVLPRNFGTAHS